MVAGLGVAAAGAAGAGAATHGYDGTGFSYDSSNDAATGRVGEPAGASMIRSGGAGVINLVSERSTPSLGRARQLVAPSGTAQVLTNQRIGNAAADSMAARSPGPVREVSLQAASGRRAVHVLTDTGLAIESKVGRTSLTSTTGRQIARDIELMTDVSSPVSSVRWEFFTSPVTGRGGPTGPLAEALDSAGIPYVVHP